MFLEKKFEVSFGKIIIKQSDNDYDGITCISTLNFECTPSDALQTPLLLLKHLQSLSHGSFLMCRELLTKINQFGKSRLKTFLGHIKSLIWPWLC